MTESRSRFIGDGVSTAASVAAEAGARQAAATIKAAVGKPKTDDQLTEAELHTKCDADITRLGRENDELRAKLARQEGFEALTYEQSKQMLEFFMYRAKHDLREKLAATLPQAYNAWCGRNIVEVVSVDNHTRQWRADRPA
jgi:hypothetical protein